MSNSEEYHSGGSRIFQEGGTNPWRAPTYYLTNYSWKLHEHEEILAQRGVPCAP